jgi:hypothetical protein
MEKLNKIAEKKQSVIDTYKNEYRPLLNAVNDNDVYAALEDPEFQAYVRLIEAIGTAEDDPCAA